MCFFNSAKYVYLEQTEHISTLETMLCRMYYFQKLTQFTQGNDVVDAPSSKTKGFLFRDTCVSLT
jgi:hypothetical protein